MASGIFLYNLPNLDADAKHLMLKHLLANYSQFDAFVRKIFLLLHDCNIKLQLCHFFQF